MDTGCLRKDKEDKFGHLRSLGYRDHEMIQVIQVSVLKRYSELDEFCQKLRSESSDYLGRLRISVMQ